MKKIRGENVIKRLVALRGKFFYAFERTGDHRLHAALNAFEREFSALEGVVPDFASENEMAYANALWSEVHGQALKALYMVSGRRTVYGLGVEPPPPAPPQFGPPFFPIAHA